MNGNTQKGDALENIVKGGYYFTEGRTYGHLSADRLVRVDLKPSPSK